ncbi:MAG: FtsH protease activity modulator HflK [Pseudomonadota bacterium]
MPYSNNGGPWGGGKKGGGSSGGGGSKGPWGGGNGSGGGGNRGGGGSGGPGGQPPVPDIDEIVRKGQEQLKVLMGGRSGGGGPSGGGGGGGGQGFRVPKRAVFVILGIAFVGWLVMSFYRVQDFERSVELTLGECRGDCVGGPGLNFAPWPLVTYVIIPAFREQTVDIGSGTVRGASSGLMLTGDENIVDINFEVVWNVRDPAPFLFNLSNPQNTIEAVAESAMREVVARSELAPILNRDRGVISQEVAELIQTTLDEYGSGVNIVRLNFDKADPPEQVIDAFREVQAARQERSTLQNRADAYANERLAGARGQAAQILQEAEGYRAREVNSAAGEASRFTAVLAEYIKAPDVTRERLYLETMEGVLGSVDMFLLDTPSGNSQGVVPYLPLNELRGNTTTATAATQGVSR